MKQLIILLLPVAIGCSSSGETPITHGNQGTGGTQASLDASTVFPDCHGEWPTAWIEKEDQLTAAVNTARAEGGTCDGVAYPPALPVAKDPLLTQMSRCFVIKQLQAGIQALVDGAADNALHNEVLTSGFVGTLSGWAGDITVASADEVFAGFLATKTQCPVLFNPDTNRGSIAYAEDPNGVVQQRWAGVMAIESDTGAPVNLSTADLPDWVRTPGPGMKVEHAGVNLAGAEFGTNVPGTFGTDCTYPTPTEVDYFMARGMNVFRLPFLWERVQPTLNGELAPAELARLTQIVGYATKAGATVVIDPHNYARRGNAIIGSDALPDSAFADFWGKLATSFKGDAHVVFGLMNEPHDLGVGGTERWLKSVNTAIAAIRATSAENLILVPGDNWTGAYSWTRSTNATIMLGVVDSSKNLAFEVHQYLDDGSGSGKQCVSSGIGVSRLTDFTAWARNAGVRAFLGEFGAPSTETCLYTINGLLEFLGSNTDVWLGWTWWAAGPWWGDYPLSIEPTNDATEAPQMVLLERYLTKP